MQDDLYPKSDDQTPSLFQEFLRRRSQELGRPLELDDLCICGHAPVVMLQPGIDTHKIPVTLFTNKAETIKFKVERLTLSELRDRVHQPERKIKDDLPLLKLAGFGKLPNQEGSLRHNKNVTKISGIELDYDSEEMSFEKAVGILERERLRTLAYTSANYTTAKPRWRLLHPLSKTETDVGMRRLLVARINGLFGGIFKPESFVLSQVFYYGHTKENPTPDHKALVIDGDFIDLREDLHRYEAVGMQQDTADSPNQKPDDGIKGLGFTAILELLGDGPGLLRFNEPLTRATASYVAIYKDAVDRDKLKALLREAINRAPREDTPKRAREIVEYLSDKWLDDMIDRAIRKFVEQGIKPEYFVAYMPQHNYIYIPTREPWPSGSVNARLKKIALLDPDGRPLLDSKNKPKKKLAADWLDENRPVEQMTWVPGEPLLIMDRYMDDGGWKEHPGSCVLNLYRPPTITRGDAKNVSPWLDHVHRIYPDDANHIIPWLAHRVQKPQEKINHALFLGGAQGIGKDTLLEPVVVAVGPWNFQEAAPVTMLGRFNGFLKAVILRVNEVQDLGEVNKFKFYEHLKDKCAAPPHTLRVDEKNLREHRIPNCCGVVLTSNHKTGGMYLPAGDRRTYVAWSDCTKENFQQEYWNKLWGWYYQDGFNNVAAYLATLDISKFNPKAPPPQTEAFMAIVDSHIPPEELELIEVLEHLGNPDAVIVEQLIEATEQIKSNELFEWLTDPHNRRPLPHRLERAGMISARNPDRKTGLWKIGKRELVVFAKSSLSQKERIKAARELQEERNTQSHQKHRRYGSGVI